MLYGARNKKSTGKVDRCGQLRRFCKFTHDVDDARAAPARWGDGRALHSANVSKLGGAHNYGQGRARLAAAGVCECVREKGTAAAVRAVCKMGTKPGAGC